MFDDTGYSAPHRCGLWLGKWQLYREKADGNFAEDTGQCDEIPAR